MNKILNRDIFLILVFTLFIGIVIYLSSILLPFFIGIFVAYLLDPFVDWLEEKKFGRGVSTTLVLILFFILIFVITFLIVPILILQTKSFLNDFPNIVNSINEKLVLFADYIQNKFLFLEISKNIEEVFPNITSAFSNVLRSIIDSSIALFNLFSILLVTPIVSWYFLKDWDKIKLYISNNLSSKHKSFITTYSKNIDEIFDSYLRGQILVSLSLSIFYSFSFFLLNINYSIFIGVFAGFFSFIPLIGIIISLIITSIITYLQFLDFFYLLYILIIFIIGQILETNILTPKLVGKKLGLHPLLVLLAIFIFGSLFGILGIIFSAPLMATIILILKRNLVNN